MEEVTIFVEFEPSSQKHLHFPLAESPPNEEIFQSFKNFLHNELPHVKVSRTASSAKKIMNPKQASNEASNEPFEIYLFGYLIFSRRKTGKSPNFPFLASIIRKIMHERSENHPMTPDSNSQLERIKTPFDLKDSKLPPLKANVNHRVQIRTGKRAYNKQLDYAAPLQGNDDSILSSPIKMLPANNNSVLVGTDLNRSGIVEKSRSPLQRRMKVTLENLKRAESQPIEREKGQNNNKISSPSKPLSPYMKRTHRKVEHVEVNPSPIKVRSGQASPQQRVENLQRGRIRGMDRVNSHLTKLNDNEKNTDSSDGSDGKNSNRKMKARLKSASHPPNSKNVAPFMQGMNGMQGSKSKKEVEIIGGMQVKTGYVGIQKVLCEDDDSVDEQNPGFRMMSSGSQQQGTMLFRNTEEDVVENGSDSKGKEDGEHIRATADFGQKFKEFLTPSPSTTKRLGIKANQKSASRYSEVSVETEGYDDVYEVGGRARVLSFGGAEPSNRSEVKEDGKEVNKQPEKEKEGRKGKLELKLEDKTLDDDEGRVMYKKGSTPQFAKSPVSEIREQV